MTIAFEIFLWVLLFLVVHVVFLIAISYRLSRIGYTKQTVIRMVILALGGWPIVFLIGCSLGFPAMYYYTGVPLIIGINTIVYIVMEGKVILENPQEKSVRKANLEIEENEHRRKMQTEEDAISAMVVIKSYLGDNAQLMAISDLGKLRDHDMYCRVEGGLVKSIFVRPKDLDRAAEILDVEIASESEGLSAGSDQRS